MNKSHLIFPAILLTTLMMFLNSCGQKDSHKNTSSVDSSITSDNELTIDTFSAFPPEIDGCSCYFSNDSSEFRKEKFIYIDNYQKISFLKVNGILTRFNQTTFQEISETTSISKAKSDKYELEMETKNILRNGDETWIYSGTIKLTDKKGKTITKKFYGECGC